jgi:hypothetical protein
MGCDGTFGKMMLPNSATSLSEATACQDDIFVDISQRHTLVWLIQGDTRSYMDSVPIPSPSLELHGIPSQVHFAQGQRLKLDELPVDEKKTPLRQ